MVNSDSPSKKNSAPPRLAGILWRRDALGWSMYDFANTIFSMNIVSSYFKPWLVDDLGESGLFFDLTVAISMMAVALVSPALGALSDFRIGKKRLLFFFTLSCVLSIFGFSVLPTSAIVMIVILFGLSNFFYEGGMVFYNALLYSVTENDSQARFLSGFGVALGYLGAIVGLLLVLPFVQGDLFGLDIPFLDGSGRSGAFLPTAVMFAVFAVPLFLFVRERPILQDTTITMRRAYAMVFSSVRGARAQAGLLKFLVADFLIKNAITAVIINIGVFCLYVIGFDDAQKTIFLMIVTVAAVVGSFVLGRLSVVLPLPKMIVAVASGWIVILIFFGLAWQEWMYWVLSAAAGICLGGVWTIHRPYLAEMVPREELGRIFGLYSLSGKAAATIGPLWWALFFWLCQEDGLLGGPLAEGLGLDPSAQVQLPYRVAAASLALLVALGLVIFKRSVRERENAASS